MLAPLPPIPGLALPPCAPTTVKAQLPVVETVHGTMVPVQEKDATVVGGAVGTKVVGVPDGADEVGDDEDGLVVGEEVEGVKVGEEEVGTLVGADEVGE